MRQAVYKSGFCELRCSSTVTSLEELDSGVLVRYKDSHDHSKLLKCSYLVGSDGKKGVVRKHFLEPIAGVKQETGLMSYTGTWIAANLKIGLPTPQTHPTYPYWKIGMTPEEVYDLYWPKSWHFCSPPGKATATGRFGPPADRYWRHEFAEPAWDDSKDSVDLLWEHLSPMITRLEDGRGQKFSDGPLTYPRDCIEVKRCRPFTFRQLVVNKWFHNRTLLIGDAAHVFPPFGGQGIACGIRDGYAVAWRLAILLRTLSVSNSLIDRTLTAWAHERRQGVDDSAKLTMVNGRLCNDPETLGTYLFGKILGLLAYIPFMPTLAPPDIEHLGYKPTAGGFFLSEFEGGGKVAQIFVHSSARGPTLSDELLRPKNGIMTLLIVTDEPEKEVDKVKAIIGASSLNPSILLPDSLFLFSQAIQNSKQKLNGYVNHRQSAHEVFHPVSQEELDLRGITTRPGYDPDAFNKRLVTGAKYAILRPDFIFFAFAKNIKELEQCLQLLKERLN